MRNLRIEKAMALGIGERGPNILIPIMYGAIEHHLEKKLTTEIDKAVSAVCEKERLDPRELTKVLHKYKTLPHQVKRFWSGDEYEKLFNIPSFEEAATILTRIKSEVDVVTRYNRYHRLQAYPIPGFAGLIPSIVKPPTTAGTSKTGCCPCCCCEAGQKEPSPPENPSNPPPEKEPKNRYSWEFGPHLKCLDEYEDHWWGDLGDDLYAVYAWGDGAGAVHLDEIPKSDGTNDLDPGETGTWPFPQRMIYPAKAPQGYLHIEIDIWEKDYSAEFFSGLLAVLGAIAGPLGAAVGGAAGGAIGTLVGQGLEAARSQISDNDDDNYLGKLAFDYPHGQNDLHTFVGSRSIDWRGNDCRYIFDYVIRELP
jgi:hypothetical protein